MDPIFLATLTSAVTHLALEVVNGAASEAGSSLWQTISEKLGFSTTPKKEELAASIARKLQSDETLACAIAKMLQSKRDSSDATALVGCINAEKATVIGRVDVKGDFIINN